MFKANLVSYPSISPVAHPAGSYTENLGHAARSFLAALLAIDPDDFHSTRASKEGRKEADPMETFAELDQLAREFEPIMPNQAAELRYLLSRD